MRNRKDGIHQSERRSLQEDRETLGMRTGPNYCTSVARSQHVDIPYGRPPPCEELDAQYDIKFGFLQKNYICSKESQQKLLPPELRFLTPICTKSFVGWGFAPNPTGGAYSAPSDPIAVFWGPTSSGRGG